MKGIVSLGLISDVDDAYVSSSISMVEAIEILSKA